MLYIQHHRNDVVITLKRVVAGGLAGMLAKSVVAPVDRVKILFQVTNETFSFKKVGVSKLRVRACANRNVLSCSSRRAWQAATPSHRLPYHDSFAATGCKVPILFTTSTLVDHRRSLGSG